MRDWAFKESVLCCVHQFQRVFEDENCRCSWHFQLARLSATAARSCCAFQVFLLEWRTGITVFQVATDSPGCRPNVPTCVHALWNTPLSVCSPLLALYDWKVSAVQMTRIWITLCSRRLTLYSVELVVVCVALCLTTLFTRSFNSLQVLSGCRTEIQICPLSLLSWQTWLPSDCRGS